MKKFFPAGGKVRFCYLLAALFFLSPLIPHESLARSDQIIDGPIKLIEPLEGSEIIAKKPVIRCAITEPFSTEKLLVLLDGTDITNILELSSEGFEFTPVQILPSGTHTLSITVYTADGREFQREFTFSTRHSEAFKDAYSSNEITTIYETALIMPDDAVSAPRSKVESNLSSQTELREERWEFTLSTNLRFLDQSLPVNPPEKKGLNLAGYLFQGRYRGDELQFLTQIGDIQINETQNTVQDLARRGGRFSLQYTDLKLNAFVVNSEQVYGFRGGTGIEGNTDDHIMGLSGEIGLFSDRIRFRTVYVTGGESGSSFGIWSPGGRKGEVLGLVLKADLLEQKLTAEAELDLSEFDADTSDEFPSESDKAYRLRVSGYSGGYSYEALYEYMGPDYEVIGNQGLQKNREGFMLRGGANFQIHSINLSFSRYNDNVKADALYPRVYTYQGMIDYTFNKIQNLPIGFSYQKTILDSTMEPPSTPPLRMDTDTVTGRVNYMKEPWNIGLQASHSIQNDRTDGGSDTTTTTYTLIPAYLAEHVSISPNFTFNRSKHHLTGVSTDTYTVNLELRGDVFHKRVTYELAGTYNNVKSSDGTVEQDTLQTNFRLSYHLSKIFQGFLNPSVGIKGLYNKTNDRANKQRNDELVLLLVFSTSMPFTF